MVLSSLKTQYITSNKYLSRVRDDVDDIGTQTELIKVGMLTKSRSKSLKYKLLPENRNVCLSILNLQ